MKNNSKNPLVSIVVPVYNVEKYLEECFYSITSQTYKNIEIILVNDGSTDNSGKLAGELAKQDLRVVVIHKDNSGPSDTRNIGIDAAKGQYITFIDSDDLVEKCFIEILLISAIESDATTVQCDNSRNTNKLGQGSGESAILSGKDAFVELLNYNTISPVVWGKLYKMSLFQDNNFKFPTGRLHEDTAILYKLIYFSKAVVCINKILYYYRVNRNSIMNSMVSSSYTMDHYGSVVTYHKELDEFININKVDIDSVVISRHKSLRLLSVLNKLALHKLEKDDIYDRFKKEYLVASSNSHDLICLFGRLPVRIPVIFRAGQAVTPIARGLLGKV